MTDQVTIEIDAPGRERSRVDLAPGEKLSEGLENNGFSLNTRCGGRGLCRGCQVEVLEGHTTRTLRSCQTRVDALAAGGRNLIRIRIPEASLQDDSLHGVDAFEIRVEPGTFHPREGLGLAVDIGTTTVAMALWDLETGRCLTTATRANGQICHGDNVLSRISFSLEKEGGTAALQQALIRDTLQPLLQEVCRRAGIAADAITEARVAGNPAMLHTFSGDSMEGLSRYPFQPVWLGEKSFTTEELGWEAVHFSVRCLPGLGPFVGADISAGALAAGLLEPGPPVLLIDFGTNGEILLRTREGFLATATAAGPAFEGGRLNCGTAARPGAVSSLARDHGSWQIHYVGTRQGVPKGLSGAAYIDFIALGFTEGWINAFGRLEVGHSEVIEKELDGEMVRCVELGEGLFVTEADVAELLQAKAAIGGGVATLMEMADLEAPDLSHVLVAGGFGYHLNPEHARTIGLLPNVAFEKVDLIGNASLGGASLSLMYPERFPLQPLVDTCRIVELNQVESFQDHFTDALMLGAAEV